VNGAIFMAIRFNSAVSGGADYNLHTIEKFNGVDYTTTPTLVDETRAIEISNYLPKGNSLVKRNGISMIAQFFYKNKLQHIHNIWKDPFDAPAIYGEKQRYIIYATEVDDSGNFINPRLLSSYDIYEQNKTYCDLVYEFDNYDYENPSIIYDTYSFGTYFEGRLFLLCNNCYLVTNGQARYYYHSEVVKVSSIAYVPTIVTGLGDESKGTKSVSLEQFNLLNNRCKIELFHYNSEEAGNQFDYNYYQFFSEEQNPQIVKINGEDVSQKVLEEGEIYIYGIGGFSVWKNLNGIPILSLDTNVTHPDDVEMFVGNSIVIEIEFTQSKINMVENMRFGVPYGSYGHRDRLFLSGNPEHPNLDIHSCEANDQANSWKDYTYFGDMSYSSIGSSDTAIKGYGFLNNGAMAIFKESKNNTPNLYFRTYEMKPDADGNYQEIFPVTISGLSIDVPVSNQIIAYGNDLLVNTPDGIYKIMAGQSTATQTYESVEMSYYIRENLGRNVANSCSIVFDGKLYICREDNTGKKRIYVADKNRYSFIDGKQVYEWFILDTPEVDHFYIFDNELYFSDKKALYKFNDKFFDDEFLIVQDANINGEHFSTEAFVNETDDFVTLSSSNKEIQRIANSYDVKAEWEKFKENTKLLFNNDFYISRPQDEISNINTDSKGHFITIYSSEGYAPIYKILSNVLDNCNENEVLNLPKIMLGTQQTYHIKGITTAGEFVYIVRVVEGINEVVATGMYPKFGFNAKKQNFEFDINELYISDTETALSNCICEDDLWYEKIENDDLKEIGAKNEVFFNKMTLKLFDVPIDFTSLDGITSLREVLFRFYNPVTSYWRSKFNSLGRLDLLKTIDRTTFVADAVKGGKTDVGYKTSFKKSSNQTGFLYKNELGFKEKQIGTEFIKKDLDFNDIDFSYFTFSTCAFAQTYTTKQKVKNFAFVQLTFESNEPENSTIVSLSFRYKYTRNNKGVR
jgi:hypothetical protein